VSATGPVWARGDAIARLRAELVRMCDDEHSLCQVAAERGIFCHGFRRWGAAEFDRRWKKAIGRSTHLSREQMEEFANLWQLAEQIRQRVCLACDLNVNGTGACRGWEEFSNEDLTRFCADLLGQEVQILGKPNNL
jgi:hypothetical protein